MCNIRLEYVKNAHFYYFHDGYTLLWLLMLCLALGELRIIHVCLINHYIWAIKFTGTKLGQ